MFCFSGLIDYTDKGDWIVCFLSIRLTQAFSYGGGGRDSSNSKNEGNHQYLSIFQVSASITIAVVPLAKASDVAKFRVSMGGVRARLI